MAIVAFYEFTPVAIDKSANTTVRLVNTLDVKHIRAANTDEVASFSTAQSAVIFVEPQGNNFGRTRTLLTATPYATLKTAFNA